MSAVVPYVPAASSALAQAIINNPEETKKLFGMAAKKVGQTYQSYKKRKTRPTKKTRLESVPNSASVSYQEVNTPVPTAFTTLGRKELYATPLTLIEPPDRNFSYGAAPANVYHLNGFRWCAKFRNTAAIPIHVHVAFVQPTRENITISDIPTDMFIDHRSTGTKYSDFQSYSTLAAWDSVQDCFKLNRRKFNVLKSMEFNLNPLTPLTDAGPLQHTGSSWKTIDTYQRCNTTFEFENTSSSLPVKPIWMLVYYESIFPSDQALTQNGLKFTTQTVGYVRNKI